MAKDLLLGATRPELQPESAAAKTPEPAPNPRPQERQGSEPRHFLSADGAVSLDISIQVNLAELKGWSADRITAFFGGIAQVVAAREKGSG